MQVGTIHKTNNSGNLEIIKYKNAKNVSVRFIATNTSKITTSGAIREGLVKDQFSPCVYGVGFMGDGIHQSRSNGKVNPAYKSWTHMLERCYSEKLHAAHPTYLNCSVSSEWESFQVYADWYFDNYPKDGKEYALDKDILIKGNKLYSSSTCMFVTKGENTIAATAKSYRFLDPNGNSVDVYNLSELCRRENLNHGNMVQVSKGKVNHHKGWTRA